MTGDILGFIVAGELLHNKKHHKNDPLQVAICKYRSHSRFAFQNYRCRPIFRCETNEVKKKFLLVFLFFSKEMSRCVLHCLEKGKKKFRESESVFSFRYIYIFGFSSLHAAFIQ